LVSSDQGLNLRSTALEAIALTTDAVPRETMSPKCTLYLY
jgi:hypothetical protein